MAGRTPLLTPGPRQPRSWLIATDVEATGRYVRQTSCPGHFGVVTLRLEIDFGQDAVVFISSLDKDSRVWFVGMQGSVEANRSLGTAWPP